MNNIIKTFVKGAMILASIVIFVLSVCSLDADKISVGHCLFQCAAAEAMLLMALYSM
jgi:hypothetical protein